MIHLKQILLEGVMDPGILKAVFLAGGPGSGKGLLVVDCLVFQRRKMYRLMG